MESMTGSVVRRCGSSLFLAFALAYFLSGPAAAAEPSASPTFESIGLYWRGPSPLDAKADARLQFRMVGAAQWQEGLPLWFDERESEYRGSLVHLQPGTRYEIKLTHDDGETSETLSASTWPESLPVASVVTLPEHSGETLTITQSGTPSGYVLYTAAPGASATIDVAKQRDFNVLVQAS
jgi:hypothetical protein